MSTRTITPTAKDHRIAARLTREHKSLFERAATLKGLTLSDFMVSSAYEAAIRVLDESQVVLALGPEDSRVFFEKLLQPRQPAELPALQAAIRAYQQQAES